MNYKEDVKRKILNDVLKLKKKKVPEEVIFTDIRGILKKYNLNASDENVLDIPPKKFWWIKEKWSWRNYSIRTNLLK